MSLYSTKVKIGGVPCGLVMRGVKNGQYRAVFEREHATLEQIEGINWAHPVIVGECVLPAGYGFVVEDISYHASEHSYVVDLQTAEQYLGDVTGYQAMVTQLTETVAENETMIQIQASTIEALRAQGGEAVIDQLAAAYQEGVESNG